ncbi:HEAT repeat domain-containing protein [Candidatus Auribacterota bacterium]
MHANIKKSPLMRAACLSLAGVLLFQQVAWSVPDDHGSLAPGSIFSIRKDVEERDRQEITGSGLTAVYNALTGAGEPADIPAEGSPEGFFTRLSKPGGIAEGEPIGEGLVFKADEAPGTILSGIRKAGVTVSGRTEEVVPAIQRYFRYIRDPDSNYGDISKYKIEFRRNIKNYGYYRPADNAIVLDTDLLNLDTAPRNILPFLAFIVGHEVAHSDFSNEWHAAWNDQARFNSFSAANSQRVIEVLRKLGASGGYIFKLNLARKISSIMPKRDRIREPLTFTGTLERYFWIYAAGFVYLFTLKALSGYKSPLLNFAAGAIFLAFGSYTIFSRNPSFRPIRLRVLFCWTYLKDLIRDNPFTRIMPGRGIRYKLSAIRKALNDEKLPVRIAALNMLAGLHGVVKDETMLPLITKALRDPNESVKARALELSIKLKSAKAEDYFIKCLKDPDLNVKYQAALILSFTGSGKATAALIGALSDENKLMRVAALNALMKIKDPRVVPMLHRVMAKGEGDVTIMALTALLSVKPFLEATLDVLPVFLDSIPMEVLVLDGGMIRETFERSDHPAVKEFFLKRLEDTKNVPWFKLAALRLGMAGDDRAAGPLSAALTDKNKDIRLYAAIGLSYLDGEKSLKLLRSALRSPDGVVRRLACERLGELNDRDSAKKLRNLLSDNDRDVNKAALEALNKIGWRPESDKEKIVALLVEKGSIEEAAKADIPARSLTELLKDPNRNVRAVMAVNLNMRPELAAERGAETALVKALKDSEGVVRRHAAGALDKHGWTPVDAQQKTDHLIAKEDYDGVIAEGPPGIKRLLKFLETEPEDVVEKVSLAIGRCGDIALFNNLVKAMGHKKPRVRTAAIEALGKIGDQRAVGHLIRLADNSDPQNREAVAAALMNYEDRRIPGILFKALKDADTGVRRTAAEALGVSGHPEAAGRLIAAMNDPDETVSTAARESLIRMGRRVVPDVIEALSSEGMASVQAAVILGRLRDPRAVGPLIDCLSMAPDIKKSEYIIKKIREVTEALSSFKHGEAADEIKYAIESYLRLYKKLRFKMMLLVSAGALFKIITLKNMNIMSHIRDIRMFQRNFNFIEDNIQAAALRAMGDKSGISQVREYLKMSESKSPIVSAAAADALTKLKDRRTSEMLIQMYLEGRSESVQRRIVEVLAKISTVIPKVDRNIAASIMKRHLEHNYFYDRRIPIRDFYTISRLTESLLERRAEILSGNLSPVNIAAVYANGAFIKNTMRLSPANQYSVARAVDLTLQRFSKPVNDENTGIVLPFILQAREEWGEDTFLGEGTYFILGEHMQTGLGGPEISAMARKFGAARIKTYKETPGRPQKHNILEDISSCPENTTVWLCGHGGDKHFWLSDGGLGSEESDDLRRPGAISYEELAEALIKRAGAHGGRLSDIRIIMDACYSSDIITHTYNYIARHYGKDVRDLPVMFAIANRGAPGIVRIFTNSVIEVSQNKTRLKINDLYTAEDGAAYHEDFAFFLPLTEDRFKELRTALGVTESCGFEGGMLAASLPVIDNFEPAFQEGTEELGQRIAGGMRFPADEAPGTVIDALLEKGVALADNSLRAFTVLQRYFKTVKARAPDRAVDISLFDIEFREGVRHFAYVDRAAKNIVLDVKLLDMEPSDLIPVMTYILKHEGTHTMNKDEGEVRKSDMEWFAGLSGHHQMSVINGLSRLGAGTDYIGSLKAAASARKPPEEAPVPLPVRLSETLDDLKGPVETSN